jgi:hypothetical protein
VSQWQGNGNGNFAPAVALGGDASTRNYQGNHNTAKSDIDQKNDVDQSQSAKQKQHLTQEGGGCCKPTYDSCKQSYGCQPEKDYGRKHSSDCSSKCEPKKDYGRKHSSDCSSKCEPRKEYSEKQCCERGQNGSQKTSFGDQWVGEQKNDADVTQKQGNWNGSFAPAIGVGGGRPEMTCNSRCGSSVHPVGGNATTTNYQGNGNYAKSDIDQKNEVDQSQTSYQRQDLVETCRRLLAR